MEIYDSLISEKFREKIRIFPVEISVECNKHDPFFWNLDVLCGTPEMTPTPHPI